VFPLPRGPPRFSLFKLFERRAGRRFYAAMTSRPLVDVLQVEEDQLPHVGMLKVEAAQPQPAMLELPDTDAAESFRRAAEGRAA